MRIVIEYEASWRNSFLDRSNNEKAPKSGRQFVASNSALNKDSVNYIQRDITKNTAMGIMNRLIGDQRKLYQARENKSYYFAELEEKIAFEDKQEKLVESEEIVYIRNFSGNTDQNSFTGLIKTNDPIFSSDYSDEFWGMLAFDFDELCDFIIEDVKVEKKIDLNPIAILHRLEEIKKEKPKPYEGKAEKASKVLEGHFEKYNPLDPKGALKILPLYCSALYLQMDRLESQHNMSDAKAARGGITGISHNGFTTKNFMDRYTTGRQKLVYGNPYLQKERIKGEGEVVNKLIKASGQLEITIDIDREKARELERMIENAGVSSFYLGKKGLAYVTHIDTREVG
jgi:hypothetical protein